MKKSIRLILSLTLVLSVFFFNKETEASDVNKHFTVSVKSLDVREAPSPRTKVVGSLKKGTVVFVYNTEAGGWSKIKYNNKAGYIATSGLNQNGISTPSPSKSTDVNKQFTVNANTLDVRESPTPRAKVVGSLKKGTSVFVYSTVSGGWSKIKYNNKAGYIATSGLKGQASPTKPTPAAKKTPVPMKDIKFGITYQQVKGKETRKIYYNYYDPYSISFLEYYADKYGMKTNLAYSFTYDYLDVVWYDFNQNENYHTNSQLREIYNKLQAQGIKEFGGNYYYKYRTYDDYVDSSTLWSFSGYEVMLHVTNEIGPSKITLSYHEAGYEGASTQSKDSKIQHLIKEVEKYNEQLNSH